ncbi:MAG: hypothetical protein P8177_08760 [Gemmatimonadota bacterium]
MAIMLMLSPVRKVIDVASVTITSAPSSPTLPTTHPKRRYMITPRMVRIDGVNTPPNVPSPFGVLPVTVSSAFAMGG